MNIQTTKRPVANLAVNTTPNAAAQAEDKSAAEGAAAPQESFTPQIQGEDSRFKAGIRKGAAWGGAMEKTLGTATGLGIAIGSGLALSLGGAMVGGLVGGSFGSAVPPIRHFSSWLANLRVPCHSPPAFAISVSESSESHAGGWGGGHPIPTG